MPMPVRILKEYHRLGLSLALSCGSIKAYSEVVCGLRKFQYRLIYGIGNVCLSTYHRRCCKTDPCQGLIPFGTSASLK